MSAVTSDPDRPEDLNQALRILARVIVRAYMDESSARFPARPDSPTLAEHTPFATPENRRLLNVDALSAYLCLPKATIYSWVTLRRIPERAIVRLGRTLRFDLKEIDAWIEQKKHNDAGTR